MKFLCIGILSCCMLSGCSSEEPESLKVTGNKKGLDDNFVTLSEALENAEGLLKKIEGVGSRSARNVRSVELYQSKTRSDNDDVFGFYVVNFESGFALLSADKRRVPVYAISDEGSLSLSDTLSNPGLAWYFTNVVNQDLPYGGGASGTDPVPLNPFDKTNGECTIDTISLAQPLLKGFLGRMSQHFPNNRFTPVMNNENTPVGCLNLAIGTIFGYYEWPASYNSYSFNWKDMKMDLYDERWARMFREIGSSSNLNTSYSPSGSGSYRSNIPRTMKNWKYTTGIYSKLDRKIVREELTLEHPVIFMGYTTVDGETEGHAWLTDGGYSIHQYGWTKDAISGDKVYFEYTDDYLHMVWGWGTMSNGYYLLPWNREQIGASASQLDPYASINCPYEFNNLNIGYGYRPQK